MAKESPEINLAGIRLSRESETPLYQQLYEQLRRMILRQRLRPGDRLPASRNLAQELGVARVIVSQAYEQLVMEGYVAGKTGAGTFVATVLPDHLLQAPAGTAARTLVEDKHIETDSPSGQAGSRIGAVPFQIGMPSLDRFPYKIWREVGNKVLKDFKQYHLGYEDTLGYWNLRKAIASYLRMSRAVTCEAEQVIVVTGSQQGLNLVAQCLLQKGDKVWMEDPGYYGARIAFGEAGTVLCPVPVEEGGLDIAYGIRHFADAKMVYVTPSHQFPMGCTLSHEKREQLLAWAQQSGNWILEDDYDSEFRYEGRPLPSLQGMDTGGRVIYSGTFSKVLFPGLRLAYIVLPSATMVERFKKIKDNQDRQSPVLEQAMLCTFMEEGYFLRHIRKMRLLYAERQQILTDLITTHLGDHLQVKAASSGMHLFCRLSDQIDVARLKQELERQRIRVSFVEQTVLEHRIPPAILLGFTAFSKYKLTVGIGQLKSCLERAVR